jgi:hypothetical protein
MGYTHYFKQVKEIDDDKWDNICKDAKQIVKYCDENGIELVSNDSRVKGLVQRSKGFINLNGVGQNSHETFYIQKELMKEFNFCKTAHKPYDLAVTAILLIIEHHVPGNFKIGSDGDVSEWEPAATLNFNLFKYGFIIPPEIVGNDSTQLEAANIMKMDFEKKIKIENEYSKLNVELPKCSKERYKKKL